MAKKGLVLEISKLDTISASKTIGEDGFLSIFKCCFFCLF